MTRRFTLAILLVAAVGLPASAWAEPTLSDDDAWMIQDSAQNSLEFAKTNQTTVWQNPDTGASGAITPTDTYQNDQGEYCREYQQTVTIGGQQQQAYGTACRMPDGAWEVVNSEPLEPPQPAPVVVYRDSAVYQPAPRPAYGYPSVWPFAFNFAWFDNNWGLSVGTGGYPYYGYYSGGYYYGGRRHNHSGYRNGHYRGRHYRNSGHNRGGHYRDRHNRGGHYRGGHYRGGRAAHRGGTRGGGKRHARRR